MIASSSLKNFVIVFALISSLLTIVPQPPAEAVPAPCVSTGMIAKWDFKQMHLDNPSYTSYGNSSCGGVNLVESSDGLDNTLTSEGLVFSGDKWLGTSSVPASLIGDKSYTISTWMKNPLGGIVSWGSFIEPEAECGNGNHLQTFYDFATNQWGIANYWWACDIQHRESFFGITNDDLFHNLVVTYNSATDFRTIYLDGIQLVREPVETAPNFLGNALRIGSTPGTVPTLTGTMRNLSIYNRELEASEIGEDFCAESVCDLVITRGSEGTERKTAFATQPEVTIKDLRNNTVTSSSAVVTATISSGGTLVGTSTATASSGVATFTNLGVDGTIGTEYTITYTATGLTSTSATVTPTGTTCDGTSFTCQVSDMGPGGGKVFYVASELFTQLEATGSMCTTNCKYLEAAPTTGSDNWTDNNYAWSGNTNTEIGAPAQGSAIGTGFQNTLAIVAQNATANRAGTVSRDYRGPNNKTDWFLPSKDELHQLRLQRAVVAAPPDGALHANYWSSTENSATDAIYEYFLLDDHYSPYDKSHDNGIFVRPIRAFGPITYTITLAAGTSGSGSNQTLTKTNGVSLTLPDSATANGYFTLAGYSVTGWSTTDLGSQTHTLGGAFTTDAATTLYPVWSGASNTVTFNTQGGSIVSPQSWSSGTALALPTAPTRSGYTFNGWYDAATSGTRVGRSGSVKNALDFDGINDRITVPHSSAFNFTTAITIEAWISTTSTAIQYITTKGEDSFYLATNITSGGENSVSLWLWGPMTTQWLHSSVVVNDGMWHHVAGTYDGTTVKLYVDGALSASRIVTATIQTGTSDVEIGSRVGDGFFKGKMYDIRYWNVARSASEISSSMSTQLTGSESGLVAAYSLNQGSDGGPNSGVTTATSQTGTNNGSLSGFALTGASSNWIQFDGSYSPTNTSSFTLYAQWTPVAPAFTLSSASITATTGSAISSYSISSTGGPIASYAISPAVGNGLSFSTSTGLISGTPTSAASVTTYTITATNSTSTATQTFSLTINSSTPVLVFIPPTPVPYLKTLTSPQMRLTGGKLVCSPGTYNSGYTLEGVIQGSPTALFTPASFTYNLLINGVTQTSLAVTTAGTSTSWDVVKASSGSLVACSVTISANSLTNTDKSSDNTSGVSAALSTQAQAIAAAESVLSAAMSANSKTYQKALVDNRSLWRKQVENLRANYYETLARVTASSGTRKMITDKSAALKAMITAQKKSASDYKASGPSALAAKDAANKVALDAKSAAIAAANATYGTFIESIGYGVLIP